MGKAPRKSTSCVIRPKLKSDWKYSITTPIIHSAPFIFSSTAELKNFMEGKSERIQPEYGRMGNFTVDRVQDALAAIEGGEASCLFASGMCAITTTLFHYLKQGDHIIITSDIYHRTRVFIAEILSKFGVTHTITEPLVEKIREVVRPETRIVLTESPTNPYLRVVDLAELARIGKEHGCLTIADTTFATPVNQRPLEEGIDLVIHSCTKYLGGHNDIIGGVLVGREELVEPVAELLSTIGGIIDPNSAFLLDRGLKTLALRVQWQNRSGQMIAEYLENHPRVSRVYYPGLPSHPDYELAQSTMSGFGGVVTFLLDADFEGTCKFIDKLQLMYITPSFGGTESLVDPPALMSFWDLSTEERKKLNIHDNLIRLAVGLEDPEDLIEDLDQALKA